MRENISKNIQTGDFYAISGCIRTDLKNKDLKLIVTAVALTWALFYVGVTTTWGVQEQKTF